MSNLSLHSPLSLIGFDEVITIRSHKMPVVHGFLMYLVAVIQKIILNFNPMQLYVETDIEIQDLPTTRRLSLEMDPGAIQVV